LFGRVDYSDNEFVMERHWSVDNGRWCATGLRRQASSRWDNPGPRRAGPGQAHPMLRQGRADH